MTPADVEVDRKDGTPERISYSLGPCWMIFGINGEEYGFALPEGGGGTNRHITSEYIRADLHTARIAELEAGLLKCAAEIVVPIPATDDGEIDWQQLYEAWRKIACDRADIARALLGDKP